MKYIANIAVLDFPSAVSGNIYPIEVVEEAIENCRKIIDSRILLGCFYDNKREYELVKQKENLDEIVKLKKHAAYYKYRATSISHIITDLYTNGDSWVAEIETLSTGKGLKLEAFLMQEKYKEEIISFRPIAIKSIKNGNVEKIQEIISVDAVPTEFFNAK